MVAIKENYQNPEYLVETEWLEQNLDSEGLKVFDCTAIVLPNPDAEKSQQIPFVYQTGRVNFERGHIPGAGFIDVPGELSEPFSSIPLMLPSEGQFAEVMSRHGICDDTRVVLYSTSEPNWSARVWWMLRAFGFNNVSILNGGWAKWVNEGRVVSDQVCAHEPAQFTARSRAGAFVGKDEVLTALNDNNVSIINSLPSPMFTGASDVIFGRRGRITRSINVPFSSLHDPDSGCYLPADELREKFDAADIAGSETIITYCGGGIAASNNAFALSLLGYDNVTVYDASMLEWGNDESLPMEVD